VQTYGRRFLYDGWNLVAEYSETTAGVLDTLKRSYTWGLDIARSMTDAGGVGALLQIADHSTGKTYLPSYDGNGNIVALFDSAATGGDAGACVAIYEYSPYGEFLRCEGAYAKENPFRFSTKFTDDETGLVYYGRRYYSPSQGRFLGRDPIEEKGGLNLYGFVSNDPIDHWDLLGMEGSQYADGSGGFDDMDAKIAGHLSDARISAVLMQNKLNARADRAMEVIVANQGLRPGQMQIRSAAEAREVLEFLGIRTLTTGENGGADVLRAKLAIWAMSDPDTYQRNITRLNAVSLASSLILGAALPGFRTSAPFVAITAADAATVQALNAAARVGPGQFVGVAESMSARAAAYQTQITGLPAGAAYLVNGVKFDGFANGVLQEAKGAGYAWAVTEQGVFRSTFRGADALAAQAQRQLTAAGPGANIQWTFAEEAAANATRALFESRGITGIEIRVVAPVVPGGGG